MSIFKLLISFTLFLTQIFKLCCEFALRALFLRTGHMFSAHSHSMPGGYWIRQGGPLDGVKAQVGWG